MHVKHPEKWSGKKWHQKLENLCSLLLLGIEPRGRDATGFVAVTRDKATLLDKNNVPAQEFIHSRKNLPPGTRTVLLHTRYSTKGDPKVWGNNHPVFSGSVFTVHNGTIYNDDDLFEQYKLDRAADVDSEIIPAMLAHYGFDNAEQAFGELGGGFATASIDPVHFPHTVLLAKGGTWPLHVLETKELFIWASTTEAIKDAWGTILGTPPTNGWGALGSGDLWIIEDTEVHKRPKAFEHKQYGSSSTPRSVGAATYADDWDEYDDDVWWPHAGSGNRQFLVDRARAVNGKGQGARTVLDTKAQIAELRSTGKGACVTYSQRFTEAGRKYLERYGNGKWAYCVHCETSVSETQVIKESKDYGTICMDCYAIAKTLEQGEGNLNEFLVKTGMRTDDFEQLQKFADLHTYIHSQALYAVARETGVKRTTIEFMLHHADVTVLEQSREYTALYCELSDIYTDKVATLWQEWSAEAAAEADNDGNAADPYVTCASGTHRQSEECEACKAVEQESACCGVSVFKDEQETEEEKRARVLFDNAPTTCLLCKRKPHHFLGLTHAWCRRHFTKCVERGCKATPIGYLPDNTRLCHTHSRAKKGFVADNDFKARRKAAERAAV